MTKIELAKKVNDIVTVCNRRYIKALRAYNRNSSGRSIFLSRQLYAKAEYYSTQQEARELALLSVLR